MMPTPDREEIQQRLSQLWCSPVTVTDPSPLAGGASRQTMRFTAQAAGHSRELVLRRDVSGRGGALVMDNEARVMVAAAAAGVPVPEVIDKGPSLGGHPYILMSHIAGETIPRKLLRDEAYAAVRPVLAAELGAIAARIHSIRADGLGALEQPDPIGALRALSDRYDVGRPSVELGIRWLRDHLTADARMDLPAAVVHGDLRNGNAIVGPEGIRAVLDWELVHQGNPLEDLGWLCVKTWRFGSDLPVGGFGTRAQLLDGYEQVAGWRPAGEQLHWWEVYGTLRWVLICRQQAAVYLHGGHDSLEHAVIGRRVCEAEFDLLLALGLARPHPVEDPLAELDAAREGPVVTGRAPHDAPDADRLLSAVARSLGQGELASMLPVGTPKFLARVAANAIQIARREVLLSGELDERHRRRLGDLGCASEDELAAAIRSGAVDPAASAVTSAVCEAVHDKLLVANPRYLGQPADVEGGRPRALLDDGDAVDEGLEACLVEEVRRADGQVVADVVERRPDLLQRHPSED
jgi:aminoglycoside phosphotransferase (APT) family kinase protein